MRASVLLLLLCAAGAGCGTLFQRHEVVVPTRSTNTLSGAVTTGFITNVFYLVNPAVTNALAKGEEIAGHAPAPIGTLAAAGLGVLSGVLGLIAKAKSDKAALVPALIAGIEQAPNNEQVKQSVRTVATLAGVQQRLHREVKIITGP